MNYKTLVLDQDNNFYLISLTSLQQNGILISTQIFTIWPPKND